VSIQPGTRLGAYEVTRLIGHGAMGTVFMARHEALDRTAAVKVMLAIGDDPAAVSRFNREGRAIALLRHPNIVTVFDYGESEGTPYMIEEFVPGGSLADRLKQGRPDRATTIKILRGIAAGLDYAHGKGIVHRDVKPLNVLMGADDTPVIADFGLARVAQQPAMTASGVATGTPAYMAPEQISDMGEIGPATDLYALATVAYEMLTGHLPYEFEDLMRLLMAKVRDDPVPPSRHDSTLPSRVDSVLLRGLARKPTARWSSCTAMVEALAGVLEPKPELFAATRRMSRISKIEWTTWAWVGPPVVGLAVLTVMFVIVPRLTHHNPPPTGGPPGVVACAAVSPNPPQIAASPNPAGAGDPVTFTGSGFAAADPFFIVIDSAGDCTNPTAGAKVFNSSSYADPLTTDPIPLPGSITPGDYQVRACNQRPGEAPMNCVQVPFTVTAAASAARTQ
jgi:serine/threonine protein kinase